MYTTKIKGLALKFHFDVKAAMVSLDVETDNLERRIDLWDKLQALASILKSEEYLPGAIFDDAFLLENGKEISRVYLKKDGVSIHNKNTWRETMEFFNEHMAKLEAFFQDFREVLEG